MKNLKAIEINDLLQFRYPSNVMYNSDATALAYECAYAVEDKNTYRHDIWLYKDGVSRQLTSDLDASAVFWLNENDLIIKRNSPDHAAGTTELYKIDIRGGEAMPWMCLPFVMTDIKPAGKYGYACLGMVDKNDPDAYKDTPEQRKEKQAAAEKEKDYQVIDEVPYVMNGQGFINGKRPELFIVNGDQVKRVTDPKQSIHEILVDGDRVIYTAETWTRKRANAEKIYAYDLKTGKKTALFNKNGYSIRNILVRDHVLYGQMTDHKEYGTNETPNICRFADGKAEFVLDPFRSLHNSVGSDISLGGGKNDVLDGSSWVTLATDEDHTEIWAYSKAWKKKVLFSQPGSILCIDAKKGKIAAVYADAGHLFEVCEVENGQMKRISSFNDAYLEDRYVAMPERIDYTSGEEKLHGWVLYPKDYKKGQKYPAVLDIHGGPRVAYGEVFFHEMQVWASKGFFVFFTNIRGSDGRDDEFADIRDQYGSVDYQNLMDFTDAVLDAYPVDAAKVCVTGGSYGGFMTNWIIGHTDRFCCAASQRSIANWISKATTSDIGLWFNTEQHGAKNLYRDWDKLWSHSPLKYIEGCKTPTLFIHSDEDYRCPLSEGMQLMQALAFQETETRMVIFHGENHNLSRSGKPVHRLRRLNEITDWFTQHTK